MGHVECGQRSAWALQTDGKSALAGAPSAHTQKSNPAGKRRNTNSAVDGQPALHSPQAEGRALPAASALRSATRAQQAGPREGPGASALHLQRLGAVWAPAEAPALGPRLLAAAGWAQTAQRGRAASGRQATRAWVARQLRPPQRQRRLRWGVQGAAGAVPAVHPLAQLRQPAAAAAAAARALPQAAAAVSAPLRLQLLRRRRRERAAQAVPRQPLDLRQRWGWREASPQQAKRRAGSGAAQQQQQQAARGTGTGRGRGGPQALPGGGRAAAQVSQTLALRA